MTERYRAEKQDNLGQGSSTHSPPASFVRPWKAISQLCIQNLHLRTHFIVGWSWDESLHLHPLERCYCENSGRPASVRVMRRHVHTVTSHNKWFTSCGTSGKLTLWTSVVFSVIRELVRSDYLDTLYNSSALKNLPR